MTQLRSHAALFLSIAAACVLAMAGTVAAEERLALIVGHNVGGANAEVLHFAEHDARRMRDVLTSIGGVSPRNVQLLQSPTRSEFDAAFGHLEHRMSALGPLAARSVVFFYYAGHGNDQSLHLGRESVVRHDLVSRLKALGARLTLVFVDACETESSRTRGVRPTESFGLGVDVPSDTQGVVVVHAAGRGEPAQESDRLQGAVFSHYLISALRGAADHDHNGRVSLSEAYGYAYHRTVRQSARAASVQHPSFASELSGYGDTDLTVLSRGSAVLVLRRGPEKRHLIVDRTSGTVVAEAFAQPDRDVRVSVPAGRYVIERLAASQFEMAQVDVPYGGEAAVSMDGFEAQPYEESVLLRGTPVELNPYFIDAAYVASGDRFGGVYRLWHGVSIGIARALGSFRVGAETSVHFNDRDTSAHRTDELVLQLKVRVGFTLRASAVDLDLWIAPIAAYTRQARGRTDADRLRRIGAMVDAERVHHAAVFGGALGAVLRVPIAARLAFTVGPEVGVMAARVETNDGTAVQGTPLLRLHGGVGYAF